jgi:hypothetical protein
MHVLARYLLLWGLFLMLSACPDFRLEERDFLCSRDDQCGQDQRCVQGVCRTPEDGGAGDAVASEMCDNGTDDDSDDLIDCLDPDCGAASCDDDNPCTMDTCESDGGCQNVQVPDENACGIGCICQAGTPRELACGDGNDNDNDGASDCHDTVDCGCQAGAGLTCCPDGLCRAGC